MQAKIVTIALPPAGKEAELREIELLYYNNMKVKLLKLAGHRNDYPEYERKNARMFKMFNNS